MERGGKSRIDSVDALRGLVMIVMALDHVRDFLHVDAMQFLPDDLTRTTTILFLTRWITHFCAPVFMFTAGIGAFFWWNRGRTLGELTGFLIQRGIWLIFLDQVVLRFAVYFELTSGPVILNVLWALGWSMIVLGLLVHLPVRALAAVSIAAIVLHNLLDPVKASQFGAAAGLWDILHQQAAFSLGGVIVVAAYPLLPWFAVMAAGFCFGHILLLDPLRRRRVIARLGLAMTLGFLAIRAINIYGDPVPWSNRVPGMTALSFLRCAKYPPSLDFLLMTLGPALLLLAWFDGRRFSPKNPLIVFGRVPMFYFLLHLLLAHAAAIPLALVRYGRAAFLLGPSPNMGGPAQSYPEAYGYSLATVYVVWIALVSLLYPLCLWFGQLKQRRRDWWLGYL